MYVPTELSITGPQLVKLYKGHPVQLTAESLKNPNSRALMHPLMSARVTKARKMGKGCRLMMSPEEILQTGCMGLKGSGRMSGCGWWSDAWNWAKEKIPAAFSWVKENVVPVVKQAIDSDFYQQKIRPRVENKVMDVLETLPYSDLTTQAAQAGFDYTGIGMKKPRGKKGGRICQAKAKKPTGGSFKNVGY